MSKIRVARKPVDAYQHGNLAEALVQAGLKLLSEGGVEKLSLRAAAQLAGVSHAAPYRHFRDKDALVSAIAERGYRLLTASMKEELARCHSRQPGARLQAIGVGYLRFGLSHPAYLQVIFGGVLSKDHPEPALREAGAEAYGTLRAVVAEAIAAGELRGGDQQTEDDVALASWAMVHGLATLIVNGAIPAPASDQAARTLAHRVLGLLHAGIGRAPVPDA
jgi:AcrR family transcriptional regulator